MPDSADRKYYIVKHDLESFEALPNYIWRTGLSETEIPHRFSQVKLGDRWIGFAYTTSDRKERPISQVTGFFECVEGRKYAEMPPAALPISSGETMAWQIKGKEYGEQPKEPVIVPPIEKLMRRGVWKQQAIVPITVEDFDHISKHVLDRQLDTSKIPLLGREPRNEQEVLAIVANAHSALGIEKIYRVRTAFPDLLVKIAGGPEKVHLELEVYSSSFFSHGHAEQVQDPKFAEKNGNFPVAVLCWIDDCPKLKDHVHQVFDLHSLIRRQQPMAW